MRGRKNLGIGSSKMLEHELGLVEVVDCKLTLQRVCEYELLSSEL